MNLVEKEQQLLSKLNQMNRVLVAFSGGVDSTYLAKMAFETLKENAIAVTIQTEYVPQREINEAKELAKIIGIPHQLIHLDALTNQNISGNPIDRCFFCKTDLFTHLIQTANKLNIDTIIDGSNQDDIKDYRPGVKALRNLGIRSPLKEVGFTKQEIRERSKAHHLPTWEKASFSCLATRIPYNETITIEKLQQIENAEQLLFELGLKQFRLRHHGEIARIEVLPKDFSQIIVNHQTIVKQLKKLGFQYVTLDLEGYVTGSLNRQLKS
ncbi:ATP-dependent sacrificial sulfur transferase LarE [Tepidibacillus fermentans]|uniref:NAD/GMP synthase domain-containing protein n=1 Tax=Tepidibacillus fermentans TaxID=1281767 RepID=A0A4R3KIB5_9BACI|nr:ATP-dependent sacrificial sulfur transferase LarE [Tepidibacillus fermentans]TCS83099.1 uncharacterized protein EDD72_10625 [Tepidibacillus fermentans]